MAYIRWNKFTEDSMFWVLSLSTTWTRLLVANLEESIMSDFQHVSAQHVEVCGNEGFLTTGVRIILLIQVLCYKHIFQNISNFQSLKSSHLMTEASAEPTLQNNVWTSALECKTESNSTFAYKN